MRNGGNEKTSRWENQRLTDRTSADQFNVVRRIYDQDRLNRDADYQKPHKTFGRKCINLIKCCGFGSCLNKNSLPIIKWLPKYDFNKYFVGDMVAGATTAVMHIPQGMAYALLAEVPPIVGLYMAFFPALVYVIFGTSPHVSVGTFAIACLMSGKIVSRYIPVAADNPDLYILVEDNIKESLYSSVEVLSIVSFAVGIFQLFMWILRLGAVSTLLSDPLVSGFTTAASIQVIASQLKDLLGVRIPKYSGNYKVVITVIDIFKNIGSINWASFVMSFITCLTISLNNELLKPWISKRTRVPVPIELLAIVIGTLLSRYVHLKELFGINLVGDIPTGLPMPSIPPMELIPEIAVEAASIMMVTYTITMSMALIFSSKDKYEIDGNQELLALGAGNVFGSFFGCGPMCASLSRSYILYNAGGKTGITTVISALLILCVLLWIGPFFEELPRSVLASIIVVSLKGLFMQVVELPKFWALSKLDAAVWIITFLTTLFINIDVGLCAGLLASVGALFMRSQRPYTCLLGRVPDTDLYLDIKRYRGAEELPGIKIFHYCGGLNFATKNQFRSVLFRKVGYLKPVEEPPPQDRPQEDDNKSESYVWDPTLANRIHLVVIDASALSYVDAPGVKVLVEVQKELQANQVTCIMAALSAPTLEMIDRYNLLNEDRLEVNVFPTVHDAVVYYNLSESQKLKVNIAS